MDFILEDAYEAAYLPFFEVLKDFKDIKINLHFSGFLFSWLLEKKPEYIALLQALKKQGQIEIISGGMYEPVLSLIPEEDGLSQIMMHSTLMEEIFGEKPKGLWLAERVYEPHIPRVLNKAGMAYTLVDDNHFKAIGLQEDDLFGYYVTEHEGYKLAIFPGLEFLRYSIPFKPLNVLNAYLREADKKGHQLAVFGDDGEKFGLWPGTKKSVYDEGWLKGFLEYLTESQKWLKTVTFSEYLANKPPKGPIYLDCQSYKEMGEWSLPPNLSKKYVTAMNNNNSEDIALLKGGYFKHFLIKYPESNDMHKKMLSVTNQAKGNSKAKKHVFMAQCNDSYWHGVFGGLYLPHLRASVYSHLIEAERCLDPVKPYISGTIEDVNLAGDDEVVLSNSFIKAYFCLREGGTLYELDYKPECLNIMANLCRRYEGYHDKITMAAINNIADGTKTIHDMILAKEEGLERFLQYDWYRRASLVDHIMGNDVTWESFYRCQYYEPGDFVKEPYRATLKDGKKMMSLCLRREGQYWSGDQALPLIIEKVIRMDVAESALYVDYVIDGDVNETFLLGVEFNFSFLGSGGERWMDIGSGRIPLTAKGIYVPSQKVLFYDPYQKVAPVIEFDQPISIWTFPVEVVSLSETGFERNYQSTMCMPIWEVDLTAGPKAIHIKLAVHGISSHNNIQ
jgi:4-alpha-glucanotransferase